MSQYPQTVSVTTLFIVSAAAISATSLAWYVATREQRDKADANRVVRPSKSGQHHSKYSTKQILTHKLREYSTFLEAIRSGDIESAVQYGADADIQNFIAIITGILAEIPFGAEIFRQELLSIFEQRSQQNIWLSQSFQFFLYSHFNEKYVQLIWDKHPMYQSILQNYVHFNPKLQSRPRTKSKGKKPKIDTNLDHKDLIKNRHQRQKQLLHQLYSSLHAEESLKVQKFPETTDDRNASGFSLSQKTKRKATKNSSNVFLVDEIEYHGDNILELFEIFSFGSTEDDAKESKSDADNVSDKLKLNINCAGFKVNVMSDSTNEFHTFCDPINGAHQLSTIQVQRIFHSNAKPLLLSLYCNDEDGEEGTSLTLSSQIIFKKGDDLRKDAGIICLFHLFNDIWKLNNLSYNGVEITCFTYQCVPMAEDYGCMEYINDCIPLTDVKKYYAERGSDEAFLNRLIATSVGSYIGAYIMGVRDRHSDNVLIRSDGTLFHIDYGYVLGEKLSGLDASKFAITHDLQSVFGEKGWNTFVYYSGLAFLLLRENYHDILKFARIALRFMEFAKVKEFLVQQLMIGANQEEVETYIKEKIMKAPNKWKTKMKNTIHSIAMNVKK